MTAHAVFILPSEVTQSRLYLIELMKCCESRFNGGLYLLGIVNDIGHGDSDCILLSR